LGGTARITTSFNTTATSANESSVSAQYASGTSVNLSATAAAGYTFDGWKGSITSSQDNMSFVVNSSKTITAQFSALWPFRLRWVLGSIAALLLIVLLIVKYRSVHSQRKRDN
jgi:uncharacterized repeat protein (TIGR02543 family)